MKLQKILLFALIIFITSCGEKISTSTDCEQTGPPVFTSQPTSLNGFSSIDFTFSLNQPSTIYYVVYNKAQIDLTSDKLKEEALSSVTNAEVLDKNTINISCDAIANAVTITASGFIENTTVYAYLVAESNSLDEILQSEPTLFEVNMLDRQPVSTFQSSVESREVLYLAYQPDTALKNTEGRYPAIIFLGGFGEVAKQGEINLIRNGSLPEYLSKGNDIPFMVFSPQHIVNNWNIDLVNEMVSEIKAKYPVDLNKIHMTGISGGGIGTWNYVVKYPDELASVVPISGDGNDSKACNMINVATWAFHNEVDGFVNSKGSIDMVNAINACNPGPKTPAKVTIFEDPGHNAWRRVYDIQHPDWNKTSVAPVDIYAWLASQSK